MRGILTVGVIVAGLTGVNAHAEDFNVAGFEKIVIVAPQLQLNVGTGTGTQVRVTSQLGRSWSVREDGQTLRLTATTNPGANVKPPFPKMDLVIPGVTLEVHIVEGQVNIAKFSRPVLVDLQKGKLSTKEMRANLTAALGQGQVSVLDHQGSLNIDIYKGDVTVSNHTGSLEVSGFQSQVNVEKLTGAFQFESNQGQMTLKSSSGTLQFFSAKSAIQVEGYKGRIEGTAQDANLSFQLLPETDLLVKSGSGRVNLVSKTSGALLDLTSEQGEITAPKGLRAGKDKGSQILRGRLKGKNGGRVEVFAQRGNITVKE